VRAEAHFLSLGFRLLLLLPYLAGKSHLLGQVLDASIPDLGFDIGFELLNLVGIVPLALVELFNDLLSALGCLCLLLRIQDLLRADFSLLLTLTVHLLDEALLVDLFDRLDLRSPHSRLLDLFQDAFLLVFQEAHSVFNLDLVILQALQALLSTEDLALLFRDKAH